MREAFTQLLAIPLLLGTLVLGVPSAGAQQGCCSWHGGIDYCDAYTGRYVCNDGEYSPTCQCSGILSTPSCSRYGLFARYNSLSGACECSYGYVLSGGQCVSEDDACQDQFGYHAKSTYGGRCTCRYGYRFNSRGSKCISNENYCRELDWNSEYDLLKDSCVCKDGYKVGASGMSCVLDYDSDGNYYSPSYTPSTCPANSFENPLDPTKCLCETGYVINPAKTACVSAPAYEDCPANSFVSPTDDSKCICTGLYQWNAGKTDCVKKVQPAPAARSSGKSSPPKRSAVTTQCQRTSDGVCQCPVGYKPSAKGGRQVCAKQ